MESLLTVTVTVADLNSGFPSSSVLAADSLLDGMEIIDEGKGKDCKEY